MMENEYKKYIILISTNQSLPKTSRSSKIYRCDIIYTLNNVESFFVEDYTFNTFILNF